MTVSISLYESKKVPSDLLDLAENPLVEGSCSASPLEGQKRLEIFSGRGRVVVAGSGFFLFVREDWL